MTGQSPQPSARSRLEQRELEPLLEFLRIPSISAIEEHAADVRDAASWVTSYIRSAGGQAEVVDWNGHPLVDGPSRPAPTPQWHPPSSATATSTLSRSNP